MWKSTEKQTAAFASADIGDGEQQRELQAGLDFYRTLNLAVEEQFDEEGETEPKRPIMTQPAMAQKRPASA